MMIRLGIPLTTGSLVAAARDLGAPLLLSANAFSRRYKREDWWNERFPGFLKPNPALNGLNIALDSAGYVAMAAYRGFPWTVEEYLDLVASFPWAWWSSMDCCCEPEIAVNRDEVLIRVAETARLLAECRRAAAERGLRAPTPIIQGWHPDDYERCAELLPLDQWPDLVGVGSVCRRQVKGPAGLVAVLERLDRILPPNVKLHLFGVKDEAMALLAGHPRIASVDSQAWDRKTRDAAHKSGRSNTMAHLVAVMAAWYRRQIALCRPAVSMFGAMPHVLRPSSQPAAPAEIEDDWLELLADGEVDASMVNPYNVLMARYTCNTEDEVNEE